MHRWLVPLVVAGTTASLAPLFAGSTAGCGTSANGVGACKQIEDARCQAAANCSQIQLSPPYSTNGSATDACIRFYDTACLHGLAVATPSQTQINACVQSIQAATASAGAVKDGGCNVVETPWQYAPSCAWLIPPDSGAPAADAGDAGDASDAGSTADSESDGSGE
jgi:hypothetical protein